MLKLVEEGDILSRYETYDFVIIKYVPVPCEVIVICLVLLP